MKHTAFRPYRSLEIGLTPRLLREKITVQNKIGQFITYDQLYKAWRMHEQGWDTANISLSLFPPLYGWGIIEMEVVGEVLVDCGAILSVKGEPSVKSRVKTLTKEMAGTMESAIYGAQMALLMDGSGEMGGNIHGGTLSTIGCKYLTLLEQLNLTHKQVIGLWGVWTDLEIENGPAHIYFEKGQYAPKSGMDTLYYELESYITEGLVYINSDLIQTEESW